MKPALIIVDMTNEFVYGRLSTSEAISTVAPVSKALRFFRENKYPVIFLRDSHYPSDFEIKLWGMHSMSGDNSSNIIDELKPIEGEFVIEKHNYSGFFGTPLDIILRSIDIKTLFFAGLDADICVRHTVADAFYRGYEIYVIREGVAAYIDKNWESYFEKVYGATIISISNLLNGNIREKQPQL